jgi:hypothetical protein
VVCTDIVDPADAPNVAPGGRPVVSIGTTSVATLVWANAAPQARQTVPDAGLDFPQRGQTMGKLLMWHQLWRVELGLPSRNWPAGPKS